MTEHSWDLKSNYMLAFTLCKYGVSPQRWDLVASDLADYINTTPQNCQAQFDRLCQQYGSDWRKQSAEPLHIHVFTTIKRLYYGDLCDRMTESRDLLMVMYDFIRLFKTGRINSNDVNEILQDIKKTASTGDNAHDSEREQKIKMLGRLKVHMMKRNPQATGPQYSSLPAELLPPTPFFQTQPSEPISSTVNENDRQVPSMDTLPKPNPAPFSSYPIIVQSNNLLIDNEKQLVANNQSNDANVDEIELSSDEDMQDRTPTAATLDFDEPTSTSNLAHEQTESTSIADELVQTNQPAGALPLPTEVSNSLDEDAYDQTSDPSSSSQPTFDAHSSSQEQATTSDPSERSNVYLNGSSGVASDHQTSDNGPIHDQQPTASESFATFSSPTLVQDDEVARMDGASSPINANGATAANNHVNAVTDEQSVTSSVTTNSEAPQQEDWVTPKSFQRQSRLSNNPVANNYRKSVSSILNSLKTAKYGYDFAKPLKSFRLPSEYYNRIRHPLDIPEIRERMTNGDYDDNILLFERDVLLMFTNALYAYQRDMDIHHQARYMIDYAMELFTAIDEAHTPWENVVDEKLSGVFRHNNDENSPSIRSLIGSDSSTKHLRRQATSNHPTPKRQRKTAH